MNKYYLLYNSEDNAFFREIDPEKFLRDLADGDYGHMPVLSEIPEHGDLDRWPIGLLLIRGEIVVPKPKTTVTEYEIP